MSLVSIVAYIMALAYGLYNNELTTAFLIATPLLVINILISKFTDNNEITQCIYVCILMLMISLHVHLLGGMIEAHFGYFVILAISIVYFSSKVIIAGAISAAVIHLIMHFLQEAGLPIYLFPHMQHSLGIVLLHAMYVVIEAIVLINIAWLFKPLVQIAHSIVTMTSGDKLDLSHLDHNDETVQRNPLQQQFYRILAEHQAVIDRSEQTYRDNSARVDSLEKVSGDVKNHAQDSLQSLKTITQSMANMTHFFHEMSTPSGQALQLVQNVSDAKNEALALGNQVIDSVTDMEKAVESASHSITVLEQDCSRIAAVLSEVEEITAQTNMLALNAAIEAARAGEHGRGFAVVATEVRTLATRTLEATNQINDVIHDLLSSSSNSINDIRSVKEGLTQTASDSGRVNDAINGMAIHIESILQSIQDISSAAQQQNERAYQINQQLSRIENISVSTVQDADKTNELLVEMVQSFTQLRAQH